MQDIRITLSFHQRQMLRVIAERGGEIEFRFGAPPVAANITPEMVVESDESVRQMAIMGLITITPLIGAPGNILRLTDVGTNIIDQMDIQVG